MCLLKTRYPANRLENLSIRFGQTPTPPEIEFYEGVFPASDYNRFEMAYTGRYLRLQMSKREYLTVCEIELYGMNEGWMD